MKSKVILAILLFAAALFAAGSDELIQQAKAKYAAGDPAGAIGILDSVIKSEPANNKAKRIIADICVDTGEREYEIRNYKNAYEYFKKAVKVLPTHPIASERYWKMKNDFDVENLKNEGGTLAGKSADDVSGTSNKDGRPAGETELQKDETNQELVKRKNIRKIESDPRLADELYTKKIIEMEKRFNKRLLDLQSQAGKGREAANGESWLPGFINMVFSDGKLAVLALFVVIAMTLLMAFSINLLVRKIKKQVAAYKGSKEYERLFGGESSQNYNELIKMQNIKELLNKIKSGELDWNTIKRSIGEMDRELRLEIFSYIEAKTDTYQQPLTMGQADILMALLFDGDEYLRRRVSSYTVGRLTTGADQGVKALPYIQGRIADRGQVPQLTYRQEDSPDVSIFHDLNIVLPLSKIVDRKVFNDNHASRVAVDTYDMAGLIGLPKNECTLYYIAGLLHDIGYLDIPSEVLNKKTALTEQEFEVIKKHTQRGVDLLDFADTPQAVKDGILYHHEKWSGEGYPDGLSGDAIPLVARIIGIFDMYEALLLPRPQRPPFTPKEALRIMKKGSGSLFDPELLRIFEKMVKDKLVSREKIWKE